MEMTWGIFRPNILGPGIAIDEFLTAQLSVAGEVSRFDRVQADVVHRLQASAGVPGVTVSAAVKPETSHPDEPR
jgi:hypothetical protein